MTFYHGTYAKLHPGDILVPGEKIGVTVHNRSRHVYMTHTGFSLTDVSDFKPEWVRSAPQYALYTALEYGCWAADLQCDSGTCPFPNDHSLSLRDLSVPPCVYVYEVHPQGAVGDDDANDVGPESCRAASASIVRRVSEDEIRNALGG